MPPFEGFAHYLAYGATDQETFRELRDRYSGVLVPATIAAYQRQGTGGFVLSLSATADSPPYMIDPRFPLFQQALVRPKKSHTALAELLGDQSLIVRHGEPSPREFSDERIASLSEKWVEFNLGYGSNESQKFDKYAKRLGEEIIKQDHAQEPELVLAPYFACEGSGDPWWERSNEFFERTSRVSSGIRCLRVVCAQDSGGLGGLLADIEEPEQLVIWASNLDEHNAPAEELVSYRDAIKLATERGHETFALYGGFFSVLLGAWGLRGASHGIGFSEHRNWRELPSSGASPARYYLPRVHRYIPQDLAQELFNVSPDITWCPCEECDGRPPIALDYHELMKHSVLCRAQEIEQWYRLDNNIAADRLAEEHEALVSQIGRGGLATRIRKRALASMQHMPEWVKALRAATGSEL